MLKAMIKTIVILGQQPTRIDQQLLIQNYSSIVFVRTPPHLGPSAPFLLYWAIYEFEIRFKSIMETYFYVYQQLSFRYY